MHNIASIVVIFIMVGGLGIIDQFLGHKIDYKHEDGELDLRYLAFADIKVGETLFSEVRDNWGKAKIILLENRPVYACYVVKGRDNKSIEIWVEAFGGQTVPLTAVSYASVDDSGVDNRCLVLSQFKTTDIAFGGVLKIGMTVAEVKEHLGEPVYIDDEYLFYDYLLEYETEDARLKAKGWTPTSRQSGAYLRVEGENVTAIRIVFIEVM